VSAFTIGALAQAANVNVETIRFYERRGLIEQPVRRASGYRQYSDSDLARIEFIRRAKLLGFTLNEIRELLGPDGARSTNDVMRAARVKLKELDEEHDRLQARQHRLSQLLKVCQDGMPGCVTLDIGGPK
jgi:MerR family copper efflux transcriptional regulator